MKRKLLRFGKGFRVAIGNRRCQAAEMVIPPERPRAAPRIVIVALISGSS